MEQNRDHDAEEFIAQINAMINKDRAERARRAAMPVIRQKRLLKPKDWADMASYFLPMTVITGAYIESGGSSSGAVATCLLTAVLVALLHLANSRREEHE